MIIVYRDILIVHKHKYGVNDVQKDGIRMKSRVQIVKCVQLGCFKILVAVNSVKIVEVVFTKINMGRFNAKAVFQVHIKRVQEKSPVETAILVNINL